MRTPQLIDPVIKTVGHNGDSFGSSRLYSTGHYAKNRPSMLSFKFKHKEERRKVFKMSLNKLKKIDDPETSLCRSVLINNTMKRLQQETRCEKTRKQQLRYPDDSYLDIKTEVLENGKPDKIIISFAPEHEKIEDLIIEKDFHAKLEEEINHASASDINTLDCLITSDDVDLPVTNNKQQNCRLLSKKRTFDEIEEYDMHEVLSQFYLPPTPRMLTGIDEDEDTNIVDEDAVTKRLKHDDHALASNNNKKNTGLVRHATFSNYSNVTSFLSDNLPLPRYGNTCVLESDSSRVSCGHASMLGELPSNVYYNLITSLET